MISRLFIQLFLFLGLIYSSFTMATDQSVLNRIANKITSIKNLIHKDTNKRQEIQHALEKVETNSGEIGKRLNITQKKLSEQELLLNNLKNNEQTFLDKLTLQKKLLDEQIQTAYILGRQPYLKLLLNQENSGEIGRVFMYYHYINESRLQTILDIQKTIEEMKANQEKIQTQYQTLEVLQTEQKNQKTQLTTEQEKRKNLLSILNKNIQTQKQQLDILIANKKRLEKTIEEVAKYPVHFAQANFSKLRNHLNWPVQGKVLELFGTQIEQSELRWTGVLIKAPEGQPVYAIAKGKVVFAKWLSGYGLLLIVSHGNGYMTLYGRNHVLYKKVGDIVQRGDLVASVGQTGGFQSPALYFAVRHNGNPINPALFIGKERT